MLQYQQRDKNNDSICLNHIHKECDNSYDENARQQMIALFMEIAEQYEGDVVGYSQEQMY